MSKDAQDTNKKQAINHAQELYDTLRDHILENETIIKDQGSNKYRVESSLAGIQADQVKIFKAASLLLEDSNVKEDNETLRISINGVLSNRAVTEYNKFSEILGSRSYNELLKGTTFIFSKPKVLNDNNTTNDIQDNFTSPFEESYAININDIDDEDDFSIHKPLQKLAQKKELSEEEKNTLLKQQNNAATQIQNLYRHKGLKKYSPNVAVSDFKKTDLEKDFNMVLGLVEEYSEESAKEQAREKQALINQTDKALDAIRDYKNNKIDDIKAIDSNIEIINKTDIKKREPITAINIEEHKPKIISQIRKSYFKDKVTEETKKDVKDNKDNYIKPQQGKGGTQQGM